nr:MAG: late control gene D protein [Bacteriophage sp.]
MINVSNTFKEKLQDGEQVIEIVEITFADGTTKTLENEIMIGNNDFSDCAESSSFPVGATVCKTMRLELDNTEDQWKDYNFYQAKVHAYLKLQTSVAESASESIWMDDFYEPILDIDGNSIVLSRAASEDRYETINKGVYTITTPEQYGEILSFTALDDMYKTNAKYYSALTLPQPIMALVRDACESLNIPMGFSSMAHGNVIVTALPDNMTFRQLIGWAAMLETANARIDNRGYLQFIKWNFGAVENGSLVPFKLEDYVSSPTLSSDDIVITGIRVKNKESESLFGTAGYVLELENNLLSDSDLGTVAAWIGGDLVGAKFRNLQGDLIYNPLLEFGDMAYSFDRNGNKYLTPITDVSSPLNGITTVKTQADDPIRNSSTYMSEATKALVEARQLVKDERTEREKAVERLANTLKESGGLYMTEDPQDDGSVIYYMHNKPTLEESDIVWKLTAEAIGISTDGGKTYPYGFTVTGEMITRLLYAEGINASYINAGALIVRDTNGKIIFSADIDNNQIVIDGASVRIGASHLDGLLNSMQGQIDGNINTWTGTPAPTLSNYPANEWLTDTEMSKHVGDLYYDGDSHAYRFRNDGKGYYWERLKDTDVTKALQDSEDALSAAKQAQEAAALAKNMTLQLSNEYQGVSVDSDGNYGTFPSDVITHAVVMYGTQDITDDCNFIITKSDSITGIWNNSAKTYTVTGLSADDGWVDVRATYLSALTVTKRFSISKIYAGNDGKNGLPGEPGRDGKTSYTHIAYANSADGKTDFSVSDSNREYIGIYVDFELQDSTNPDDYAWTLVKGADGANGSPGKPGTDGRTPYFHVAYANSADGKMGFDVSDSTGKEYIGQYTDYTEADSTNPGAYSWTKIKGEQGVPGRTYFLESPSYVIKQRANGSVAPNYITLSAWYRDGNAETRTAYKGRFKIEESVDGENWKTVYSSAKDETSVSHNLYTVLSTKAGGIITTASGRSIGIPRDVSAIKCTLYAAGGFSQPLDSQSMAVVIDVDALTHEEIFNLLTNDGAIKGIYKEGNQLYISFTYAKGGTLKLGGPNNGYGTFEVYDASGNVICKINNTDGFKNIKGNEWAQTKESIFSAGYGSITDGLLDLSAQYENKRNVVLQSVTGDLIFKVAQNLMIEGMKALTAGNPMVFSPTYLYVGYSSSSSMHYKVLGKSIKEDELEDLYRIKVIWAKYKDGYLSEQDERYGKEMPMFIAEDIDRRFPLAVDHNEKGKAENWNYRIMIPCMFAMLKNDHEKVLALQSDNQILLSKIDALSAEVEQLKELINNISRKD